MSLVRNIRRGVAIYGTLRPGRLYSTVDLCPPPDHDTGCTYCMPDLSKFPATDQKLPPAPIHDKHLVICTGTSGMYE